MLIYLMLFLFIFYDSTIGDNSQSSPCCKTKIVGGISYSFKREDNTDGLNCLSDCVYERDDTPGSNFCFARGSLEVKCVNSNQTERFFESLCCHQRLVDGVLYDLHNSTANLTIARKNFCPSSCVYQVAKTNNTSDLFCFDAITNKHDSECFIPAKLNNLKMHIENAVEANSSLKKKSVERCGWVFEHINYGGSYGYVNVRKHKLNWLNFNTVWNDRISSLTVTTGCKMTVYTDPNKGGSSTTFTQDTPWVGKEWNDVFSSVRCTCGSGSDADWDHCSFSFPCEDGKGDCDVASDCKSGKCGTDNCRDFNPGAEPDADCCIGTLGIQEENDYVFSQNYPSDYSNDIEDTHSISVPSGHHLYITFIEFDIEYVLGCSYDSLKIIDFNDNLLFSGCGNWHGISSPPRKDFKAVIESNVGVKILFKTDRSAVNKGFKLKLHLTGPSCSGTRSLVPDGRAVWAKFEKEQKLAPNFGLKHLSPNSDAARVSCTFCIVNDYLNARAWSFDHLAPTLVFQGPGSSDPEVKKWKELKCSFERKDNFNEMVRSLKQFNNANKLVIVTHGWKDGDINDCKDTWVSKMADSIRANDPETATIAVCWNSRILPDLKWPWSNKRVVGKLCEFSYIYGFGIGSIFYYSMAASTGKVGEFLAKIVTSVQAEFPNIGYTHGIGHSLGAHVMGNIFNFGKLKLNRISGLDPAGPCFEDSLRDINIVNGVWGLTAASADFVDNIHTDGAHYGTYFSKGHLDFFAGQVDSVGSQPTCTFVECLKGCCHSLAIEYYKASITHREKFRTAYHTKTQDNNEESTSIQIASDQGLSVIAGYHYYGEYHATSTFFSRMYLPIFKNKHNDNKWAAICDLENLSYRDAAYCCKCCALHLPSVSACFSRLPRRKELQWNSKLEQGLR